MVRWLGVDIGLSGGVLVKFERGFMVELEGSTPQTDNPIPESLMSSDFHGCSEALVTGEIY